jgi:hypothetical protein
VLPHIKKILCDLIKTSYRLGLINYEGLGLGFDKVGAKSRVRFGKGLVQVWNRFEKGSVQVQDWLGKGLVQIWKSFGRSSIQVQD